MTALDFQHAWRDSRIRRSWVVLLGLSFCVIGFSLRLPNLGSLGLWGDEGYTAIAVKAILEKGYPELPSGGIYFRSVPFLYTEALFAAWFGLNEYALRLFSVFCGMGAVFVAYVLGKRLFGPRIGCVFAALMVFSSWEIEFSRYARMYALFQFLYLASLYVFYRGFIENNTTHKVITFPIWLMTIAVQKLGITLLPLLVVPMLLDRGFKKKHVFLGISGVLLLVFWKGLSVAEQKLRYGQAWLQENIGSVEPAFPLDLPAVHLVGILGGLGALLGILGIAAITYAGLSFLRKHLKWNCTMSDCIVFAGTLAACLANQVSLALLWITAVSVGWKKEAFPRLSKATIYSALLIIVATSLWTLYGVSIGLSLGKIAKGLIGYPDLYNRVVKYLIAGWPVELFLACCGLLVLTRNYLRGAQGSASLFVLVALGGGALLMGFANQSDNAARYSYHLFPLLLLCEACFIAWVMSRALVRKHVNLGVTLCMLNLLFFPNDSQIVESIGINSLAYGEAIPKPLRTPGTGKGYLYHPDYEGPSSFVRTHVETRDIIISMEEVIPYYYVGRLDYLWIPQDEEMESKHQFAGTGVVKRLTFQELHALLEDKPQTNVWLINDHLREAKVKTNVEGRRFLDELHRCVVFTGKDGQTRVHYFSWGGHGLFCKKPATASAG